VGTAGGGRRGVENRGRKSDLNGKKNGGRRGKREQAQEKRNTLDQVSVPNSQRKGQKERRKIYQIN